MLTIEHILESRISMSVNYFQMLWMSFMTFFTKPFHLRVDKYVLTAVNNGAPVTFTFSLAMAALKEFSSGNVTVFQIGSTQITVVKDLA